MYRSLLPAVGRAAHAQIAGAGEADEIAAELEAAPIENTADADPWEGFNRKMFAINDSFDSALMVPAAKAYRAVTHKKQRKGIRNFIANLRTPVTLVNDVLQGEFGRAGKTASRFVINSTIGFGGMGDPAERLGIEQHSEDFGQTLAVWGVDSGPYVVLPFSARQPCVTASALQWMSPVIPRSGFAPSLRNISVTRAPALVCFRRASR